MIEGKKFDAIHVGAAAKTVPTALIESLEDGGVMIIPVGAEGGEQFLEQIENENGKITRKRFFF